MNIENIRNFAIIAHIDHGKSTVADRLIQLCGGLEERELKSQVLDSMEIERERGITIKAQTVRLNYKAKNGQYYQLNLIDTPGHVDFTYEVSRSLSACEGSILVIDSSQGVEAQTLANVYQAIENNHEIILVFNKIDLPAADPEKLSSQVEEIIGLDTSDALMVSAKTGEGISDIPELLIKKIPYPEGKNNNKLKALLIDSWYDTYLGVVILVRVVDGILKKGLKIKMTSTDNVYQVEQVGIFTPKKLTVEKLFSGEIGFITAGIKHVTDCKVGDTITEENSIVKPFPGFKPSIPVVFCGLFPVNTSDFEKLKNSLLKLSLNDSSLNFEAETSSALGFGFRCGFLGLLHLEVVQERLEREFDLNIITTAPSVIYRIHMTNGEVIELHNPADMPDLVKVSLIEEPWIKATILVPDTYLGHILKLCNDRRGEQIELTYVTGSRVMLVYRLPLNEVVFNFYDRLKSISKGYASFDYHIDKYEKGDLVRVRILVNSENVDPLSFISHRSYAEKRGRDACKRLKEVIPRQLFKVAIQAAISNKVIARETVPALRKDVTAKCYGGDISRKRKLLEKQRAGKKKMRQFGKIEIPQKAFLEVLKNKD